MNLEQPWPALEARLRELAEGSTDRTQPQNPSNDVLIRLGFVRSTGELSQTGHDYYLARFVLADEERAAEVLGAVLKQSQVVTAFCEPLWANGDVPVSGAISLLKRITGSPSDVSAKRWLGLMNTARIVAYNRNRPRLRVLFNPSELVLADEESRRERTKGHVISPTTPYGNLVAVRDLVRSARGFIRWYEQHMPSKVMEVLYRQVEKGSVSLIRILSGPANVDQELKDDFQRFRTEMARQRSIEVTWRVLSAKESFRHHDRHFLSDGIARNLPPLNSILAGSTGEILESGITSADFDGWWAEGTDVTSFSPLPKPSM